MSILPQYLKGSVIWQSPRGNTKIAPGGKVEVVVSKGPEKKPIS